MRVTCKLRVDSKKNPLSTWNHSLPEARAQRCSCSPAARGYLVTCTCRLASQSLCDPQRRALPGTWTCRRTVRGLSVEKKTVKKRNPGYSRSARYWQAAAAATMQEEAALTSCPLKIKADFKFICVYELRPLGCDLSTVFNVHIQNISKTITCVQTLLWSYHHKRH